MALAAVLEADGPQVVAVAGQVVIPAGQVVIPAGLVTLEVGAREAPVYGQALRAGAQAAAAEVGHQEEAKDGTQVVAPEDGRQEVERDGAQVDLAEDGLQEAMAVVKDGPVVLEETLVAGTAVHPRNGLAGKVILQPL